LLEHFGGVYLDYSLAVIEPLDWILNVNDSPFLENKFG
jgi:mannosyltransferase OCH1-like enzyme